MLVRQARLGSLVISFAIGCGGGGNGNGADAHHNVDAAGTHPDAGNPAGLVAVPLTATGALVFTAPMKFGTQSFDMLVDTGSSSTGVAATSCTNCEVSSTYTPGSGATDQHATASSSFGDGTSWSGEAYADTAAIGAGYAVKLDFVAITTSNGFFRGGYDGIVGLGPDDLLLPHTTSYIDAAVTAGMLPQFAFEECANDGTMWLGGYDNAAVAQPVVFTPMTGAGYYTVGIAGMAVGATDLGLTSASFGDTIVDTGTSISFIPAAAENAILSKLTASAGYQAVFGTQALSDGGCVSSQLSSAQVDAMLPALGITFPATGGGASTAVPVAATRSYLFDEGGGTYCFAFANADQLGGMSLIGGTLLDGVITVFDVANHEVGFAPEAGCPTNDIGPRPAMVTHGSPDHPWWLDDPRVRVPPVARAKYTR